MIILKYLTLALILLNLPTFGLTAFGSTAGSFLSALLFGCIALYYFLSEKEATPLIFVLLGVYYYLISGINYFGDTREFIIDAIKYFIFIVGSISLIRETSRKELGVVLFIGVLSVIINAFLFSTAYGRYGGLYLNPNRAGLTCLDRKSTRLNSSHVRISYAVFCLKKKTRLTYCAHLPPHRQGRHLPHHLVGRPLRADRVSQPSSAAAATGPLQPVILGADIAVYAL